MRKKMDNGMNCRTQKFLYLVLLHSPQINKSYNCEVVYNDQQCTEKGYSTLGEEWTYKAKNCENCESENFKSGNFKSENFEFENCESENFK